MVSLWSGSSGTISGVRYSIETIWPFSGNGNSAFNRLVIKSGCSPKIFLKQACDQVWVFAKNLLEGQIGLWIDILTLVHKNSSRCSSRGVPPFVQREANEASADLLNALEVRLRLVYEANDLLVR